MLEQLQRVFPGINLRPGMACEISPYGVLAARQDAASGLLSQFVPLAPGTLHAGTKAPNVAGRTQVIAAIAAAAGAVAERGRPLPGGRTLPANRALTLIVPDATARVLLLDFDSLPSKKDEAMSILRFRLRKLVAFEVEDAAITWQTMPAEGAGVRVLVIVMPRDVLREYEGLVREAGFLPGVVIPSTIAALPLLGTDAALLVNRNGNTLTTAILRGQDLLLHRVLDFSGEDGDAQTAAQAATGPRLPQSAEARAAQEDEDIRQSVSVAMAYFEDTLSSVPSELFYIGPETAEQFAALLGEPAVVVKGLSGPGGSAGEEPRPGQAAPPAALMAPVTGALYTA